MEPQRAGTRVPGHHQVVDQERRCPLDTKLDTGKAIYFHCAGDSAASYALMETSDICYSGRLRQRTPQFIAEAILVSKQERMISFEPTLRRGTFSRDRSRARVLVEG